MIKNRSPILQRRHTHKQRKANDLAKETVKYKDGKGRARRNHKITEHHLGFDCNNTSSPDGTGGGPF